MRILHTIATVSRVAGGPSYAVLAMAEAAAKLGHDVSVHATTLWSDEGPSFTETAIGSGRLRIHVHQHQWPPLPWLYGSLDMARALSDEIPKADIVDLHSMYLFHCWWTHRICVKANVPYILRPHGTLDPYIFHHHRWRKKVVELLFQDRVTRGAEYLHYTSTQEEELAQPFVFGRPGIMVPLGVDLSRYENMPTPDAFLNRHPEARGRKIVLFLSRLSFKKGLEILIPAFARAATQRDDLHLVIAGPDYGFEAQARALVDQYGIAGRTTFTGDLQKQQVLEAFAAANIFALSSHTENFGLAAAEAMAAGTPSILSDQVQIAPPAAADGACICLPLDIPKWTEAILHVFSSEAVAAELSRRGCAHALSTYSWDAIGPQLVDMYEAGIASHRARRQAT
jgi:glycosyltransferase involved in cell wall biosynthesis